MGPQTGARLAGAPRSCFRDLRLSVPQNDPDKEYNMPKDGTVHELTSNVGAAGDSWGGRGGERWQDGLEALSALCRRGLSLEARPTG